MYRVRPLKTLRIRGGSCIPPVDRQPPMAKISALQKPQVVIISCGVSGVSQEPRDLSGYFFTYYFTSSVTGYPAVRAKIVK